MATPLVHPVVPHLTTALTGPLYEIERHFLHRQRDIEHWFRLEWLATPAPFYSSVDLRNSGFKVAPVDTNLFPGGFNNLNPSFAPLCVQALQVAAERLNARACRVLVVPENHSRNLNYLESLETLVRLLGNAGFETRIGSLMPDLAAPTEIALPSGRSVTLEPARRNGRRLETEGFSPCLVLLNNDLSAGRPAILEDLDQPLAPPLALGWSQRLKSMHFTHYQRVARHFAETFGIDPWLIDPLFRKCSKIDFMKHEGEECLAANVEDLLGEIREKYREHGIHVRPFVIVKSDVGTYGMNIMTVYSGDDVLDLNRKTRTRMAVGKEGQSVRDVIVQEGLYSFETWGESRAVAEPVVYMIDHFVVGGFYRVNSRRGQDENLNAPGMSFEALAFAESCANPDARLDTDCGANRFYAYGVVARLAALAAAHEMKAAA